MREEKKQKLNSIFNESNHIVFFGGAGVSTESGIPDFRSKDELYNQKDVKFNNSSKKSPSSIFYEKKFL